MNIGPVVSTVDGGVAEVKRRGMSGTDRAATVFYADLLKMRASLLVNL